MPKHGFAYCVLETCKAANADVTDMFPYCPKTKIQTVCLYSNCSQNLRSALAATLAAGARRFVSELTPIVCAHNL